MAGNDGFAEELAKIALSMAGNTAFAKSISHLGLRLALNDGFADNSAALCRAKPSLPAREVAALGFSSAKPSLPAICRSLSRRLAARPSLPAMRGVHAAAWHSCRAGLVARGALAAHCGNASPRPPCPASSPSCLCAFAARRLALGNARSPRAARFLLYSKT